MAQQQRQNGLSYLKQWRRTAWWCAGLALAIASVHDTANAQSTFGTVLGIVRDPSGSLVPGAKVDLLNTGTNASRSLLTNTSGTYEFVNVEIGNYRLGIESPGFQRTAYGAFDVAARATVRIDVELKVALQATSVSVEAVAVVKLMRPTSPKRKVAWN